MIYYYDSCTQQSAYTPFLFNYSPMGVSKLVISYRELIVFRVVLQRLDPFSQHRAASHIVVILFFARFGTCYYLGEATVYAEYLS